jgi:hypothetical protein
MPRARSRPLAFATFALLAACSHRETAKPLTSDEIDPSDASKDAGPTRAELAARLARLQVTHDDFARPVLYTWTTPDQIADLRKSGVLLVKDGSTKPSGFDVELDAVWSGKGTGSDLAALLRSHPGLIKQRYAWTAPLATRRTLNVADPNGDHGYGDALIRVVLRDDAYVGKFESALTDPWKWVDMHGRAVPTWEVVAHPERIGAVYHVVSAGSSSYPIAYREYVLCNETMIDEWSVATQIIRDEVEEETTLVEALAKFDLVTASAPPDVSSSWPAVHSLQSLEEDWSAAVAFANAHYLPTKKNLEDLARVMRAWDPTPPELVMRPKAIFPLWPPPPPPPPIVHPRPPAW